MTIPKLKYPLVLAHGFMGFRSIGPLHYFAVTEYLEKQLNLKVYRPEVPAMASIEERSEALRKQLPPNQRVNIIAHSMAGLDCRRLLCPVNGNPDAARNVSSLVTLGTPHNGSKLADRVMVDLRVYPKGRKFPSLSARYRWDSKLLEKNFGAVACLTTEYAATFNKTVVNNPNVDYISVCGYRPPEEISPFLKAPCYYLEEHEGKNDGLVSVKSANWGSESRVIKADHMELVGWKLPLTESSFLSAPFENSLVQDAFRYLEQALPFGESFKKGSQSKSRSEKQKEETAEPEEFQAEAFYRDLIQELANRGH
eukprot:gb/GECG01006833.1/.p1 GENE.gb/GECG01006833.1/~~gb/GECG01006833.1/.p1  ORF type:complete len:311 (+),score=26.57 gb/GECG01006833.1/:1-933(+)